MKKRILYLNAGLLGTTFVSFCGGQSALANPPKAIVKSDDANIPDMQDELADHCLEDIVNYWQLRIGYLVKNGGRKYTKEQLDKLTNTLCSSKDVDDFWKSLIKEKKYTLPELNNKFSEYYDLAMKDKAKRVDCHVVSCHVLKFLRTQDIKSYMMHFETSKANVSHDTVIYAVLENGEENWYVCDMEQARCEALKIFLQKGLDENLLRDSIVTNFLKMPLIDYVKKYVPDFRCNIFDDTVGKDIVGELGYTDEYWLSGEFVKQKCTKEFQEKFLIDELKPEEILLLEAGFQAGLSVVNSLPNLPFRLFERQKGPMDSSGRLYNSEKNELTFYKPFGKYGRLYSLSDKLKKITYSDAIFIPQLSS